MRFTQLTSIALFMSALPTMSEPATPISAPYCQSFVEFYDRFAPTPLGFSGQDLLVITGQKRPVQFAYGYKQGESVGTLTIEPLEHEVRYIRYEPVYPNDKENDVTIFCPNPRVEVDINLGLFSEDGAFNDNFSTTLFSSELDWCFDESCPHAGEYADSSFSFMIDQLNGNFHEDVNAPVSEMRWHGRFNYEGFSANISYVNYQCDNDGCVSFQVNGATIEDAASH